MTDRDRETVALPHWQDAIAKLGDKPVVLKKTAYGQGLYGNRRCTSHSGLYVHSVLFLARCGVLTLQSESNGVAIYVRTVPPEPKVEWAGGI